MANKAYKYRVYPLEEQITLMNKTIGCSRFIYNKMLEDKINHYKSTGTSLYVTSASYKKDYPFLKEVDSLALCNAQLNLNKAYSNFFKKKAKLPKFKRKGRNDTYTTNNVKNNKGNQSIEIIDGFIKLPKIGMLKIKQHRPIGPNEKIKNVTVSKKAGKFYVSINVEYEENVTFIDKKTIKLEKVIGLDYSSAHLYVDSNGKKCGHNRYYKESQEKLAKAQRKLAKKQKGSKNTAKQKLKIQKIHEKIANQRLDSLHKESNEITNRYDVIGVEDINLNAIKRSLKLGKNTSDNGFGMFRGFLEYKALKKGKYFIKIDKFYPSSKTCHSCSYINKNVVLGIQEWTCPNCSVHHDRDLNAAINIQREAYRLAML